jgi:hypothetical protein
MEQDKRIYVSVPCIYFMKDKHKNLCFIIAWPNYVKIQELCADKDPNIQVVNTFIHCTEKLNGNFFYEIKCQADGLSPGVFDIINNHKNKDIKIKFCLTRFNILDTNSYGYTASINSIILNEQVIKYEEC